MQDAKTDVRLIFDALIQEIEAMDPDMFSPPDEITKKEKVIGTVTDPFARRVFSLATLNMREGKKLQIDVELGDKSESTNQELQISKHKYDALMETFWYLVRSQANNWQSGVGIRKDWQLVEMPDKTPRSIAIPGSSLPNFLRKIIEDLD